MNKQALLERVDQLKQALRQGIYAPQHDQWDYDQEQDTYTVRVGEEEYTLTVVRHGSHSEWTVTHPRYAGLPTDVPVVVAAYAKNEALDWTRAHLLGHYEPQHAE